MGLSAADEVESFGGCAESRRDVECVAEGDDFEGNVIFVELSEFFGEFVDLIEEGGGERGGDIEGDVPCAGGSECGFDEAKGFEYGGGVFEVAAEVSFDLHEEEAGSGESEDEEAEECGGVGFVVDGGGDAGECVVEFVFE